MVDNLIERIAKLMREQAAAYQRLKLFCERLAVALTRGEPEAIESLTRSGEAELLSMRARLAQITSSLSSFATIQDRPAISSETRKIFEEASQELLSSAREFQQTRQRAAALAINGVVFAGACIEMCGVQPTTYRAPYVRRGGTNPWA
ncbi:MAG: hypothetical protein AB1489_37645 [Acidobacteriota bacterium]